MIDIYGEAPMSVAREVGELLYALAFSACPATIVEFGTSFGASTVYLAAALADIGAVGARVIACEAHPGKARLARENLKQAGLAGLVDVRQGDARETLDDLVGPIDMLFLDGLNRLYLPMLKMLEARLAIGALIVADLQRGRSGPAGVPALRARLCQGVCIGHDRPRRWRRAHATPSELRRRAHGQR